MRTLVACGVAALALVSCKTEPPAPAARPPVAALAPAVQAEVILLRGKVEIVRDGVARPATDGSLLEAGDSVRVPTGGLALLALKNRHVVAIDEELTVPVVTLAKLAEAKSERSAEEQLAAFAKGGDITPEEKTRAVGFQSRILATTSGRSKQAPPPQEAQADEQDRQRNVVPQAPAPAAAPAQEEARAKKAEEAKVPSAKGDVQAAGGAKGAGGGGAPPSSPPVLQERPAPRTVEVVVRELASGCGLRPQELRVLVKDGRLVKARLVSGAPTPECLAVPAEGIELAPGVADGWTVGAPQ